MWFLTRKKRDAVFLKLKEKYGGLFATPEFSSDNAAGVAILTYLKEKTK